MECVTLTFRVVFFASAVLVTAIVVERKKKFRLCCESYEEEKKRKGIQQSELKESRAMCRLQLGQRRLMRFGPVINVS